MPPAAATSTSDLAPAAAASVAIKKERIDEEFELCILRDTVEVPMSKSRAKVKTVNGANEEKRQSTDQEATPAISKLVTPIKLF